MRKGLYQCPACLWWWCWWVRRPGTLSLARTCRKCGHMVRAQLKRDPNVNGRTRGWVMLHRPWEMPDKALRMECRNRNRRIINQHARALTQVKNKQQEQWRLSDEML
jgi:hypothetical protein